MESKRNIVMEPNDTGYIDADDKPIYLGDILYNPAAHDYWVVDYAADPEQECPYDLVLNGDRDDYYMSLDEPVGFILVMRANEPAYETALNELHQLAEERKE